MRRRPRTTTRPPVERRSPSRRPSQRSSRRRTGPASQKSTATTAARTSTSAAPMRRAYIPGVMRNQPCRRGAQRPPRASKPADVRRLQRGAPLRLARTPRSRATRAAHARPRLVACRRAPSARGTTPRGTRQRRSGARRHPDVELFARAFLDAQEQERFGLDELDQVQLRAADGWLVCTENTAPAPVAVHETPADTLMPGIPEQGPE